MTMHNPPHPVELLKEDYIHPLLGGDSGLTITQIAKDLGVGRQTLSNLINERSGISPEMALRLEKAFPNSTAGYWMNLQKSYDLWLAKQNVDLKDVISYSPKKRFSQLDVRI